MARQAFKKCLGIDIGSTAVEIAEISADRSGAKVVNLIKADIPAFPDAEAQEIGTAKIIRDVIKAHNIKTREAVFCLPGQQVFMRRVSLPDASEDHLTRIITFEAKQQIPFPEDRTRIEYQIFRSEGKPDVDVLMAAARKDQIASYMRLVGRTGLKPIGLSVSSLALYNYYHFDFTPFEPDVKKKKGGGKKKGNFLDNLKKKKKDQGDEASAEGEETGEESEFIDDDDDDFVVEQVYGLLNVGETYTDLIIGRKGKDMSLAFIRPIMIAGKDFTKVIQASLGLENEQQARDMKQQAVVAISPDMGIEDHPEANESASLAVTDLIESRLAKQIQLSLDYFIAQPDGVAIDEINISGGMAALPGLPEIIEDRLAVPAKRLTEPENSALLLNVNAPSPYAEYPIAIGAALSGIGFSPVEVNFLPESVKTRLVFPRVEVAVMAILLGVMIFLSAQMGSRFISVHQTATQAIDGQIQQIQPLQTQITKAEETRTNVNDAIVKFTQSVDIQRRAFPLEVYAEIVRVMKSSAPLAILTYLDVAPHGKIELVCRSSNPRDAANIQRDLNNSDMFEEVLLTAETPSGRGEIFFRIQGTLVDKSSRISTPRPDPEQAARNRQQQGGFGALGGEGAVPRRGTGVSRRSGGGGAK